MRIAFSGTHYTGKSSLIAALLKNLPLYTSIPEPYHLLEEEGYEFSDPPSLEDFEKQFVYSMQCIRKSTCNTLFDRSPFDPLAYAPALIKEPRLREMQEALDLLDLIVFVPIENPDRIAVPRSENKNLRKRVDERLYEFLLNDSLGVLENLKVLEVVGSLEERVQRINTIYHK